MCLSWICNSGLPPMLLPILKTILSFSRKFFILESKVCDCSPSIFVLFSSNIYRISAPPQLIHLKPRREHFYKYPPILTQIWIFHKRLISKIFSLGLWYVCLSVWVKCTTFKLKLAVCILTSKGTKKKMAIFVMLTKQGCILHSQIT